MQKDEILNASKREHRNKDLAEIEVIYQAGSHAGRCQALIVRSWKGGLAICR